MLIYLAGPLTAKGVFSLESNVQSAMRVFHKLMKLGIHSFCPHMCALHPDAFDIDYEAWMRYDFAIIERCDALLMLDRWESSSGARREHELALELRKTIFYDVDILIATVNVGVMP